MRNLETISPYNKILISNPGFYHYFTNWKKYSLWTYDKSSIPYLIEELVAHAAAEIAIPASSVAEQAIAELPKQLMKYVSIIDKNKRVLNATNSVLEPIYNEYDIEVSKEGLYLTPRKQGRKGTPWKIVKAIQALQEELYEFLLGSFYQLQVSLNYSRFNSAINYLRENSKNSHSKASLAILSGVTSTYTNITVPSIALKPAATCEQMIRFRDFVEDQEYLKLSENNVNYGIPALILRAKQYSGRLIRKLSGTSKNKSIVNVANQTLSTAINIKLPDIGVVENLVPNKYFPPIISLSDLYLKAYTRWVQKPIGINDALDRINEGDEFKEFIHACDFSESSIIQHQPRQSRKGVLMTFTSGPILDNEDELFISHKQETPTPSDDTSDASPVTS